MSSRNHSRRRDAAVLVCYLIALTTAGYVLRDDAAETFSVVMLVISFAAGAAMGRISWLFTVLFVEWIASVIFASYVQVLPPDKDESLSMILVFPVVWFMVIGAYVAGAIARRGLTKLRSVRAPAH
jgi:hypothetical protein